MVKIATVFSGIGSVEHALNRLGIENEIVFACDIDKYAKQSYFANYHVTEDKWFDDINDIDGKPFKNKVDLFVGGSPCQSFSMVGKRHGLEDIRGQLIYQYIRLVSEIQPKVFIYENVKGLLSHDNGNTWEHIEEEFKKLNYHLHKKVINSKENGIPQNRERLFLIGFKKDYAFEFPKPMKLKVRMADLLEDNPDSKYYLKEKGITFVTSEKNLKKKYTQINGDIALCQKANQQFNWHGDFIKVGPKEVEDKYFLSDKVKNYVLATGTKNFYSKPEIDLEVARPLLSTMAKMHRAGVDNYISRGEKIRKLTPRECLRLMGFSDDFKIVVSDTQMYKQAGNSIVVNNFIRILENIDFKKV